MALVGSTQSKGFDVTQAYLCIASVSSVKIPFAEHELHVIFRIFKDKQTYESAPSKDEYFLEQFTMYIDAIKIAPEDYFSEAYARVKQNPRFANFVDA